MEKVRVDKWLWAVRIFKTRSLSTKVVKDSRVTINGLKAKASTLIEVGNNIVVPKNGINYTLEVKKVIAKRVSAPLAAECYVNKTSEEELLKLSSRYIGKGKAEFRDKGEGRPTKKDRREIDLFKEQWEDWDVEENAKN